MRQRRKSDETCKLNRKSSHIPFFRNHVMCWYMCNHGNFRRSQQQQCEHQHLVWLGYIRYYILPSYLGIILYLAIISILYKPNLGCDFKYFSFSPLGTWNPIRLAHMFSNGWEKTPIRSSISECDNGLWSLLSPFLQVKRVLGRMEVQLKSGCGFFLRCWELNKKQENFKIWNKIWWLFWGDFWFLYLLGIHLAFLMVRYVYFMNDFWIHIWTWFLNDPWTKCVTHSFTILWNIYFLQGFQISTVHYEKGRTSMGILMNLDYSCLLVVGLSHEYTYFYFCIFISLHI